MPTPASPFFDTPTPQELTTSKAAQAAAPRPPVPTKSGPQDPRIGSGGGGMDLPMDAPVLSGQEVTPMGMDPIIYHYMQNPSISDGSKKKLANALDNPNDPDALTPEQARAIIIQKHPDWATMPTSQVVSEKPVQDVGPSPLLQSIGTAEVEGIKSLAGGIGNVAQGAWKAATSGFAEDTPENPMAGKQQFGEGVSQMGTGLLGATEGTAQAAFAIPGGVISKIPVVGPALGKGTEMFHEQVNKEMDAHLQNNGIDPESEQGKGLKSGVSQLFDLTVAKLLEGTKAGKATKEKVGKFMETPPKTPEQLDLSIDKSTQKILTPKGGTGTKILDWQDNVREGVKNVARNKDIVQKTIKKDAPESLSETSQVFNALKEDSVKKWKDINEEATNRGAKVDFSSVISEIEGKYNQPSTVGAFKTAAAKIIKDLKSASESNPIAINDTIEQLNALYRENSKAPGSIIIKEYLTEIKKQFYKSIEDSTGISADVYKAVREEYGSNKASFDAFNKALGDSLKDKYKGNKRFQTRIDEAIDAGKAVATIINPQGGASMFVGSKILGAINKYMNNPNTVVKGMFKDVQKNIRPEEAAPLRPVPKN